VNVAVTFGGPLSWGSAVQGQWRLQHWTSTGCGLTALRSWEKAHEKKWLYWTCVLIVAVPLMLMRRTASGSNLWNSFRKNEDCRPVSSLVFFDGTLQQRCISHKPSPLLLQFNIFGWDIKAHRITVISRTFYLCHLNNFYNLLEPHPASYYDWLVPVHPNSLCRTFELSDFTFNEAESGAEHIQSRNAQLSSYGHVNKVEKFISGGGDDTALKTSWFWGGNRYMGSRTGCGQWKHFHWKHFVVL